MNGIINTDYRVFLVKFQWQSINGNFIVRWEDLPNCLKECAQPNHGVEYIKEFDIGKNKFKRVSKNSILALFKHSRPEDFEYLKNHSYFK